MKQNLFLFVFAYIVYFIVDMSYQLATGFRLDNHLFEEAGISRIFTEAPSYPFSSLSFWR